MKLLNRILIIVLACLAAISCTQTPKSGKRIVFIGDSITDGNWGCIYNYKRTSSERSHTHRTRTFLLDMGRHTPDLRRAQTHGGPLA